MKYLWASLCLARRMNSCPVATSACKDQHERKKASSKEAIFFAN